MPAFINSPFQRPILLQKGVPTYLIGSFSQQVGNTKLSLLTDAIATNLATITATYVEGPLPVVGSLISIINSTNSTGAFNVQRVAIASVSYSATTNVMTLTFALNGTNQTSTADAGTVIIEPAEVGETISGNYTSQACLVAAPKGDSQFTVPFSVVVPSGITALTATLQVAIKGQSNEWTNTTSVVTVTAANTYSAGPVVQATLQRGYLYRVVVSGVTGSAAVVAKIG